MEVAVKIALFTNLEVFCVNSKLTLCMCLLVEGHGSSSRFLISPLTLPHRHPYETVPQYQDDAYSELFRLTWGTAQNIAQQFERSGQYKLQSGKYGKLAPLSQVLIFLWFIGFIKQHVSELLQTNVT
ncbi:hypothetical protein C0J52_21408 [Blattella germanica]|nr:hypothetical protein C0J52_21408 [Blattella germanica]